METSKPASSRLSPNGDGHIESSISGVVYHEVRQLGDGSFSTVSLYEKHMPNENKVKLVALKKLKTSTVNELELAMNELKILSIVAHPNVITYFDSFTWRGKIYIEMEYADAGTLAEFIASLKTPPEEGEILVIFKQIVSALVYLHSQDVIHRDIKSSNIFMTKQGFIKVGDFGISKKLEAKIDADSFVGTPFYLCPEIWQGKSYNKPCDVWALGCVLVEMATLRRTFDEANLSALKRKIIKSDFTPLGSRYSKALQKLTHSMLNPNPSKRPTMEQVAERIGDQLQTISLQQGVELWACSTLHNELGTTESLRNYIRSKRQNCTPHTKQSFLFRFELMKTDMNLVEIKFPARVHLKQLAKGPRHLLGLTDDNNVYSWGEGWGGELGHGASITSLEKPQIIESLLKYSIVKTVAGKGFSFFLSGNGIVLSCGRKSSSCLLQANDCWRPRLVDAFLKLNVIDIDASEDHVVIVTDEGHALSWGRNTWGKLGRHLAQCPLDCVCPQPGLVEAPTRFVRVFCGEDATGLVDSNGMVWLCGYNAYNKLNLNHHSLFMAATSTIVEYTSQPSRVNLKHKGKLKEIHLGRKHSVFLFHKSKVLTIGCNDNAQLGVQGKRSRFKMDKLTLVEDLRYLDVKRMAIGNAFTLAMSSKNVYFFGTRKLVKSDQQVEQMEARNPNFVFGNSRVSLMDVVQAYGPDSPIIKTIEPKIVVRHLKDLRLLDCHSSVILNIQSILNVYSSKTFQVGDISLNSIYCFAKHHEVFVIIDLTTTGLDAFITPTTLVAPNHTDNQLMSRVSSEMTSKHSYGWINEKDGS